MSPAKSGPYTPLVTAGIAVIVIVSAPYQLAVALWHRIRARLAAAPVPEQPALPQSSRRQAENRPMLALDAHCRASRGKKQP